MPGGDSAILAGLVRRMKERGSDPLRPLLDAYLLERDRAPERHVVEQVELRDRPRPGGRMSPSDLCGCERAAVFKFVGMPGKRRIDPDQQLVFDDGNWRHHKWQAIFHDMERVLGRNRFRVIMTEAHVTIEDLYVAGSLDNVLWLRPNPQAKGFRVVLDIKGINDAGFQYIIRTDAPIPKHVKQLVAYCRAVGVRRGLLWYENKNNQLTKAFLITYEDEAWYEVEGWCRSVLSYLERQLLPPMHPECDRGTYTYERCPYSSHCFGRKAPATLERMAYKYFDGIDDAWEEGHAASGGGV